MAGIVTTCPSCSHQNEVDPAFMPPGTRHASCWYCAARFPLVPSGAPAEAPLSPFGDRYEAPAALTAKALALGKSGASRSGSGLATLLVVGGVAVVALGVVGGVIAILSALGSRGVAFSTDQFRAGYHSGTDAPRGETGTRTRLASAGGFSLARSEVSLFAVGNDPRSVDAARYAPPGVPEDTLPRLRELHGKMLTRGFVPLQPPSKTALQQGQQQRFHLPLRSGVCYQVAAFAGQGAEDVDLLMYQPDGVSPAVADTRGERDASVDHCPLQAGEYHFELRMPRGGGLVTYVAYAQSEDPSHARGHVIAIDPATGSARWDVTLEREVSTSPAFSGGAVVVGTRTEQRSKGAARVLHGGALVVLDAADGTERCLFETDGPVVSSPLVVDGVAFFGSCGLPSDERTRPCAPGAAVPSKVYAVAVEDCSAHWTTPTSHPVVGPLATDGDRVFFSAGSRLHAASRDSGQVTWTYDVQGHPGPPVMAGDAVVVASDTGALHATSARRGEPLWRFDSDAPLTAMPAATSSRVFVGAADGTVYAVDVRDGSRLWDYRTTARVEGPLAVVGGVVYALSGSQVTAIDAEDGTVRFQAEVGRGFTAGCSPLLVDGVLHVADGQGWLHTLR